VKVKANQVGYYPKGHRREVGDVFEIPESHRLALWMDPLDPTVERPPRKRNTILGRPVALARSELLANMRAAPQPTTLSEMARGEVASLRAQNDALAAQLAALSAQLAALAPKMPQLAAPVAASVTAEEMTS